MPISALRLAALALGFAPFGLAVSALPAAAGEMLQFQSPSGNIHCLMETGDWAGVRCDMRELTPSYKKAPADCDLDWGNVFVVEAKGKGILGCAGDTIQDPRSAKLAYGKTVKLGAFSCSSEQSGITCTNGLGHGFTLSKAKQKLF